MSPILPLVLLLLFFTLKPIYAFWSEFYQYRGPLIFNEDFNTFNKSRWQHIITAWRGGNQEFEYYTNRPENR